MELTLDDGAELTGNSDGILDVGLELDIKSIRNRILNYRLEIRILKQKLCLSEGRNKVYENEINRLTEENKLLKERLIKCKL